MSLNGDDFRSKVFPFELEVIRRRRKTLGLDTASIEAATATAGEEPSREEDPASPSTGIGLCGLALSGGGIRSATICLGVIQAMAARGTLRLFDYLSTVSGGGYMGACLSSILNDPEARPEGEDFPLAQGEGHQPGSELRHLRTSGSYLTPGGILNRLRLPTVIVRGILLNLLIFLPYIMLAVLLTEVAYETGARYLDRLPVGRLVAIMVLAFAVTVVLSPVAWRLFRKRFTWRIRNVVELVAAFVFGLGLLTLTLIPFTLAVRQAIDVSWPDLTASLRRELENPFEHTDIWKWIGLLVVVLALVFAGQASTRLKKTSNRLLIYALGLLGPAAILGLYLIGCIIQIDSPWLPGSLRTQLPDDGASAEVSAELRHELGDAGVNLSEDAVTVRNVRPGAWVIQDLGRHREHVIVEADSAGGDLRVADARLWDDQGDWIFLGVLGGLFLFNLIFLDVNISSPHGFYRDRLSAAYLFKRARSGGVEPNDTIKLSKLNGPGTAAPYHLVNVALNLQGSADPEMSDRHADFFILSPGYCGGRRTGYCRTSSLEKIDDHVDLGTAMAVSGAAASPNMGVTTLKPLVFVLTLLNIRLGYWLPNPARLGTWRRRLLPTPWLLLKESVSAVSDRGPYVNVSDGGHLENLGVYELLRRRCKLIVAIDAEEDPQLHFGSLVKLIRYARIDLGIEIEVDLEPLRLQAETRRSRQQWVIARLDYGHGEEGHLLYLKSTLTENLANEDIRGFLDHRPAFPHQPTSDQFFDEAQFEAYRSLGYQIASRALEDPSVQELLAESGAGPSGSS